jgi:hypothetical protein
VILSFTRKDKINYVAWNDQRPIVQAAGSCESMFENAERADGLSFSDEPIPGWNDQAQCPMDGYWAACIGEHGTIYSGHVEGRVSDAVGWTKRKKYYWAAGNRAHQLTADQYTKWVSMSSIAKKREYIAGLFPAALAI